MYISIKSLDIIAMIEFVSVKTVEIGLISKRTLKGDICYLLY